MGNFYCNFTTHGPTHEEVIRVLNERGRTAFVSPTVDKNTIVYERSSNRLDEAEIDAVGGLLSAGLGCAVLAVAIADDSELWAGLYKGGNRTTGYYSRGPRLGAAVICRAFGHPWRTPLLWSLFHIPFVLFETFRHHGIAKVLGIPTWCVASGYKYISNKEFPPGLSEDNLLQTGRGT